MQKSRKLNSITGVAILFLLIGAVLTASGCAVARALNDEPGTDISSLSHGISKAEIQALLGAPSREWVTKEGISYCVYTYDGGYKGNSSEASAMLFIDIIGAGLPELFVLIDPDTLKPIHEKKQIAVAYDPQGHAVGVFDDFADFEDLPDNGKSRERKSILLSEP